MADVPSPATVSVSRSRVAETPRHVAFRQDSAETPGKTADLHALALLVLARDTRRDTGRDKVSRADPVSGKSSKTLETASTVGQPTGAVLARWGEAEAERAAIVEHDGNVPRAWAEGYSRLDPDRPAGDVPLSRWQRFVDDVGRFLDSPFCAVASALGWTAYDIFGCDRDRPFARIDQEGLLWLLNGDRLIALSENTATVERRTGARQIFRRRPLAVGDIVLAWELIK
jgi:hypothetical protein